jgi:uncharacterized membrane protein YdjX (TVP38/TMEM64 family)
MTGPDRIAGRPKRVTDWRPEVTRPRDEVTRPRDEVTRPRDEVTRPRDEVTNRLGEVAMRRGRVAIGRLPRRLRERSVARFLALLLLLGVFGLAMLLVPEPHLSNAPALVDRLGPLAPVAAVLVGALLLVVLVPRTLVTVAWGALFGPLGGAAYALAAALLAAALGFGVGRLLGREFVAARVRGRLARLDAWFARQNVLGVITVRLLPVGGFGLVSYGYGTTGARILPFLVGTMLASVPSAFGYAAVGAAVSSPGSVNLLSVAPAGFGLIATAVIVRRWWRGERRRRIRRADGRGAPRSTHVHGCVAIPAGEATLSVKAWPAHPVDPGQTTTLTIRPGTTMTLRGSRPASCSDTASSAARRTSSSGASAGTSMRPRTLPPTCTG